MAERPQSGVSVYSIRKGNGQAVTDVGVNVKTANQHPATPLAYIKTEASGNPVCGIKVVRNTRDCRVCSAVMPNAANA